MKKIQLGGHYKNSEVRGYALIDDDDFELVSNYNWNITSNGYAQTTSRPKTFLHRMINKTPAGMLTDHINRNKLDNRKENLRSANKSQNAINTGMRKTNTSGYTGVSWNKNEKKWESHITRNYKKITLGLFKNIFDAVESRKKAELIY